MTEQPNDTTEPEHHKQEEFCTTRALYRQGRNLTAVKVFTVSNESRHILIYGVPAISLRKELKSICLKYGHIKLLALQKQYKTEIFTECYHAKYERIQSARIAKRFIDNKSFYGGVLHVCYAPEFEDISETRAKLQQRRKDIATRINKNNQPATQNKDGTLIEPQGKTNFKQLPNRKKKHPALPLNDDRLKHLNPNEVWKNVPEEIDPRVRQPSKRLKMLHSKHYEIFSPHVNDRATSSIGPELPNETPTTQKPVVNLQESSSTVVPKQDVFKRIVFNNKNTST